MDYGSDNELNTNKLEQPEQDDTLWLDILACSNLFSTISHQTIYHIVKNLEDMEVEAGEKIIVEGNSYSESVKREHKRESNSIGQNTPPVYYYFIKKGKFLIHKKSKMKTPLKVGELGISQGFGEEAVLTGAPYHTSITAVTDGTLMLLDQDSFIESLAKQLVKKVSLTAFRRMAEESNENSLTVFNTTNGSLGSDIFSAANKARVLQVSMGLLHVEASKLPRGQTVIVVPRTEEEGKIACFRLAEMGCKSYYLDGQYGEIATTGKVSTAPTREEKNKPPRLSLVTSQPAATISTASEGAAVTGASSRKREQCDARSSFNTKNSKEQPAGEQEAQNPKSKATASTQVTSARAKGESKATSLPGASASVQAAGEQEAQTLKSKATANAQVTSTQAKGESKATSLPGASASVRQSLLGEMSAEIAHQRKKLSVEDLSGLNKDTGEEDVQAIGKIEAYYARDCQQVKKALMEATHYRLRYAQELQKERDQLIAIRQWINRKVQIIQENFSLLVQKKAKVDEQISEVEKEIFLQKKDIVAEMKKTVLPKTGF